MTGSDGSGGSAAAGATEFDVIVIGAGPVGENMADYAVRGGLSAALVENELVGGECSYWACMPSKALLRTPHAVAAARRLPGVRVEFDPAAVLARRDEFSSHWSDDGQVTWAEGAGITVVRGRARLAGVRRVLVTDGDGHERELRARHAVAVCTGSVPTTPPIPGLDGVRVWHSREATSAQRVPGRLGVLGGGVVGVEMAQAWSALGAEVTLLARDDRLLPSTEPIAGELVADGLRAAGVDVRLNTGLDEVKSAGDGQGIELRYSSTENGTGSRQVDELLVATGRRPNTADIGLAELGLDEKQPLRVDDSGMVLGLDGGWLYAAGDVTGRAPLTHQGKYGARIAAAAIVARANGEPARPERWSEYAATADHVAVPQVVFTDPEVAAVGLTAEKATEAGHHIRTVDLDIAVAGSYLHADGYTGKARAVIDTDRDVLLGVTFVGPDVAELLHAATIAVAGEVPLGRLWHAVPAFPTVSEVWLRLLEACRSGSGS
ncbi:dihydrolipoyl dehydrogenase family protein [Pseudonocardia acaciae]|uniref:dihydrolipoyl dehydrogenase family protein n=1 Tax=Pseudonocardia acaciae TaxID=551276 RepID=UPI0006846E74|nr:NAD(P)/FAD-dependent oxidoreductase [Pseudonocardia acaciae]